MEKKPWSDQEVRSRLLKTNSCANAQRENNHRNATGHVGHGKIDNYSPFDDDRAQFQHSPMNTATERARKFQGNPSRVAVNGTFSACSPRPDAILQACGRRWISRMSDPFCEGEHESYVR